MPRSIGEVHVSAALSNIAVKFKEPGFVAHLIFPRVGVAKEADYYWQHDRSELKTVDDERAIADEAKEVDWSADPYEYFCKEYALRTLLPDRVRDNADSALKPRITTVEKLTKRLLRNYEKRTQTLVQGIATFTNYSNVATAWSVSTSDPEADVDTAKNAVRQSGGQEPNFIVMSYNVGLALKRWLKISAYTEFREYLAVGKLPPEIWDLKIIIAGAIEDTAMEGQTASVSDIWNDNVWVGYIEPGTPDVNSATAGWTITQQPFKVRTWREESRRGEMIEASIIQTEKVISADLGYLLVGALTGSGS